MQSPLATAEPAHGALRWPAEGAGTAPLAVVGTEAEEGYGRVMGVRETVERQHERKGETRKN